MEVKGNVIIHGSYIDIHDNEVVNLSVDKAQVNIDGDDIRRIEGNNDENPSEKTLAELSVQKYPDSVRECFSAYPSELIKQGLEAVVNDFYLDSPAYLALIEAVLYDHGLLRKRNTHTSFVRALVDWGILPHDLNVDKTSNGMASKFRALPSEGYKQWGESLHNEREYCAKIGAKLDASLKYTR